MGGIQRYPPARAATARSSRTTIAATTARRSASRAAASMIPNDECYCEIDPNGRGSVGYPGAPLPLEVDGSRVQSGEAHAGDLPRADRRDGRAGRSRRCRRGAGLRHRRRRANHPRARRHAHGQRPEDVGAQRELSRRTTARTSSSPTAGRSSPRPTRIRRGRSSRSRGARADYITAAAQAGDAMTRRDGTRDGDRRGRAATPQARRSRCRAGRAEGARGRPARRRDARRWHAAAGTPQAVRAESTRGAEPAGRRHEAHAARSSAAERKFFTAAECAHGARARRRHHSARRALGKRDRSRRAGVHRLQPRARRRRSTHARNGAAVCAWIDTESRRRFGAAYAAATAAQRHQILDDIAWPRRVQPEFSHGVRVLHPLPRHGGVRVLLERDRREGSPVPGQCSPARRGQAVRSRRSQARRELRPHEQRVETEMTASATRRRIRRQRLQHEVSYAGDGSACATPMCSASGARIRKTPTPPRACPRARRRQGQGATRRSPTWWPIPAIDAIWLSGPNHARIENVEEIVAAIETGKGTLKGIACEKPLARNVAEAKKVVELVKRVGVQTGYLENQLFAPQVEAGTRCSGPAAPRRRAVRTSRARPKSTAGRTCRGSGRATLQGGGVLNDMMCHSALVVRHLLTKPGAAAQLRQAGAGHRAHREPEVDAPRVREAFSKTQWARRSTTRRRRPRISPACTIEFETDDGHTVLGEATTSWSFVGAGLRLSAELLGSRVLDVVELARCGAQALLQPRGAAARRARISSRSKTPRWD